MKVMGHNAMITRRTRILIAFFIGLFIQPAGLIKAVEHDANSELGCGGPPEIDHGLAGPTEGGISSAKDDYKDGENVTVSCNINYKICGPEALECRGHKWSKQPKCIPIGFCSRLTDIENGFVHQPNRATPLTNVAFSCLPGYTLTGNQSTTCNSTDGLYWTWTITKLPSCVKDQETATQPTMISIKHGSLTLINFQTAQFACNDGYKMVVEINISLAENGQLNIGKDAFPICKEVDRSDGGASKYLLIGGFTTIIILSTSTIILSSVIVYCINRIHNKLSTSQTNIEGNRYQEVPQSVTTAAEQPNDNESNSQLIRVDPGLSSPVHPSLEQAKKKHKLPHVVGGVSPDRQISTV